MNIFDIFNNRRSVNWFHPEKPLPQETLKSIIDTAALAPSAFNLEPWRIIAVSSDERKQALQKLAMNQPKVSQAPVTLIIVGDRNGWNSANPAWEELEGIMGKEGTKGAIGMAEQLYGSSEERKIKFSESNAGLFAMSIMYAAMAYGVDSHPMSGMDFAGIKEEFGLGEGEEPVMLIALGYADTKNELWPRRSRKGFEKVATVV